MYSDLCDIKHHKNIYARRLIEMEYYLLEIGMILINMIF